MIQLQEPWWLLSALPVAGLAVAYLLRWKTRTTTALRFSNVELLRAVAPKGLAWRRHVAAGVFLLGLLTLVTAMARPAVEMRQPLERATVILAMDVSLSMQADDVQPTRLEAAQDAAKQFVRELPKGYNLGLVTFARSASVLVPPGKDRQAVIEAIDTLELSEATATGEAVFTSLEAIATVAPDGAQGPPPARILLLSDGYRTYGRPVEEAAAAADEAQVPVSTIAFGTDTGTVDIGGTRQRVPVDRVALAELAESTGGYFYEAASSAELKRVYQDMGSSIGYRVLPKDISSWFGALSLLLGLSAGGLHLLWTSRLI